MSDFVKTPLAEQAHQMCQVVLTARKYSRAGQIVGDPGTGKSSLTDWLAEEFGGVRIECWAGMGDKHMLQELARAYDTRFGTNMELAGTSNTLFQRLVAEGLDGKLLLVDEANHLRWRSLEVLRGLSDKGAGLILSGTDLLSKTMTHPQIRIYMEQLRQRIGAKKIVMQPIAQPDELAAYVLAPRFPSLTKTGAKRFHALSGGNWRSAHELADACERLMSNEQITKLDDRVVETAAAWMAGHS
ncbi:ATP-binding protein [Leisingera sp. MMG026]|uniref:ATP-binding protein n=1 Tax=Leisingera sp. MMG026 TaxID=2909982 RepID=UPI001F229041|nr:ATP-binding protein [Leisingera sp. MMG026]MCF6432633.1 ATP-binding protein [Leisingera sp. MMG026]